MCLHGDPHQGPHSLVKRPPGNESVEVKLYINQKGRYLRNNNIVKKRGYVGAAKSLDIHVGSIHFTTCYSSRVGLTDCISILI